MKKLFFLLIFIWGVGQSTSAQTIVTFYTTLGSFEVELYDTLQPITAGNFKTLVNDKFYDGIIFHRIISNFVIQGGDPNGNGTGGPGYTIPDEFDSSLSNIEKTLSMANAGPNTGGSQFFINTKNNTFLDFDKPPYTSAHPVFGIVISGWDTVEMIENVQVNSNDKPLVDVVMDSIRVTQFPLAIRLPYNTLDGVTVYPNPANEGSVIEILSDQKQEVTISLYDVNGIEVMNRVRQLHKGENQINLSDLGVIGLAQGVYVFRVQYGAQMQTTRIILSE
ncbi:peptidylprolyl isomerase [bacterium SCSIO 12643]|nr:peptidylprolyl isomerase [bacterium SCSIO 12643]